MSKKKSPYKNFSVEQVSRAELTSFVIMVGNDFYAKKGCFVFSKQQAEKNYNLILSKMIETIHSGTEREKKNALKCMATFNILPLRIQ